MNHAIAMMAGILGVAHLGASAATPPSPSPFAGTWTLVAADVIRPDGTVARDYGEAPRGRLHIDDAGRYALQIYDSARANFASPDKAQGTPSEFAAAVLGASTHFGTVTDDADTQVLSFAIEGASFPNWEHTVQRRAYERHGNELRYRVPARPDGSIPTTVWRRVD